MTTNPTPGDHPRINVSKLSPEVYQAMFALERAVCQDIDPTISDLVKIRASQINHCAFCIDLHIKDARKAGETEERIHLLNAWREAEGYYTEKERAALALAEAVTVLTDGFVPDEVYERAARHFGERELAQLISAIAAINAWNRLAVTTRKTPGHQR